MKPQKPCCAVDKKRNEKNVKGLETEGKVCAICGGLYPLEQVGWLPKDVIEIAAGSGNPTVFADLKEGQVVLDVGCGGGIDCFLAARKVGSKGKVIGIDKSSKMIKTALKALQELGFQNVEFKLGEMENLPLDDESVDVVMSNCVVSISKRRDRVFREAFRVLRPGGRLAISDLVNDPSSEKQYLDAIREAGFKEIQVIERRPFIFRNKKVCAIDVTANKPSKH